MDIRGGKTRYLILKHYRTDCMLAFGLTVKSHKDEFLDDLENLLMGPFQFKLTTDIPCYDRVFKYKGNTFSGTNKVKLFEWLSSKEGWNLSCCFGDKFAEEYIFSKVQLGSSSSARPSSSRAQTSMGNEEDW